MIKIIHENWLLIVVINSLLSLVVTPIIIAIINKKTISFSSADDIIKLREYKDSKKITKKRKKFAFKLYKICFQRQKKYKGWILWDFNELGNIENRWFRVINKEGEYLTLKFPEHIIVRKYGYDSKDRLHYGHYFLEPNLFQKVVNYFSGKYINHIIEKNFPCLIKYLEDKKLRNEKVEINEIFSNFKKVKFNILEKMIIDLKMKKKRNDLTDLIIKKQIGTDKVISCFD